MSNATYTIEEIRHAWEAGFKLCRTYGDNWHHWDGAQKERTWDRYLESCRSAPPSAPSPLPASGANRGELHPNDVMDAMRFQMSDHEKAGYEWGRNDVFAINAEVFKQWHALMGQFESAATCNADAAKMAEMERDEAKGRVEVLQRDAQRMMVLTTAEWVSSPTQMDKDWRVHVRLPLQKAQTTACGKTLPEAADRAIEWFVGYGALSAPSTKGGEPLPKRPEPFGKHFTLDKKELEYMRAIENYADALEDLLARHAPSQLAPRQAGGEQARIEELAGALQRAVQSIEYLGGKGNGTWQHAKDVLLAPPPPHPPVRP